MQRKAAQQGSVGVGMRRAVCRCKRRQLLLWRSAFFDTKAGATTSGRQSDYGKPIMKLTYWVAHYLKGDRTNSIIARTKHDCEQKIIAYGAPDSYAAPVKKSLLYTDAFDLFEIATGTDGGRGMG